MNFSRLIIVGFLSVSIILAIFGFFIYKNEQTVISELQTFTDEKLVELSSLQEMKFMVTKLINLTEEITKAQKQKLEGGTELNEELTSETEQLDNAKTIFEEAFGAYKNLSADPQEVSLISNMEQ